MGFTNPCKIQERALPLLLANPYVLLSFPEISMDTIGTASGAAEHKHRAGWVAHTQWEILPPRSGYTNAQGRMGMRTSIAGIPRTSQASMIWGLRVFECVWRVWRSRQTR